MALSERWILDDGVFGLLAQKRPSSIETWPCGRLLIADATERAARDIGRRGQLLDIVSEEQKTPLFEKFSIQLGDVGWQILYEHLRQKSSDVSKDLAEHEAIAWCLTRDQDAIFVSCDKLAVTLALAELGRGRVAHPFELWERFHEEKWITSQELDGLLRSTKAQNQGLSIPWRFPRHSVRGE
jgi:hypothetical protein